MFPHRKHWIFVIPGNGQQKNYEMPHRTKRFFLEFPFRKKILFLLKCLTDFFSVGPSPDAASLRSHLEGCVQFYSLSPQRNTLPAYPQGWAFPHALFPSSHQGCSCLSAITYLMCRATCLRRLFGNLYSASP